MCNDIFDCIEKKSLSKENTYTYNYEIKTNQINDELINEQVLDGFETEENGKCPINCNQCYEGKKCIKCRKGYYFSEYDRTLCVTGKDLREYYTLDNGTSYFS